jgi:hypothetical protein
MNRSTRRRPKPATWRPRQTHPFDAHTRRLRKASRISPDRPFSQRPDLEQARHSQARCPAARCPAARCPAARCPDGWASSRCHAQNQGGGVCPANASTRVTEAASAVTIAGERFPGDTLCGNACRPTAACRPTYGQAKERRAAQANAPQGRPTLRRAGQRSAG